RLFDQEGRRVATVLQSMVMPQPPVSLMPDETLILTLGRPQGVEAIPDLPGFQKGGQASMGSRRAGEEIVLARLDARADAMPGRWYGYDAARALIVDTADPGALAALEGLRGQALVEWVKRGGHLVVAVGANWQAVRDSILAPLLPGLPTGQER